MFHETEIVWGRHLPGAFVPSRTVESFEEKPTVSRLSIPKHLWADGHATAKFKGPIRIPPPDEWAAGIEWEPQFTLLNYPNKDVMVTGTTVYDTPYVGGCGDSGCKCSLLRDEVWLHLPLKTLDSIDGGRGLLDIDDGVSNLEVRTKPTRLPRLSTGITLVDSYLAALVKVIARTVGPVGVFLPQTLLTKRELDAAGLDVCVTKHFNFSMNIDWMPDKTEVGYTSALCGGTRMHVPVPYQFSDYRGLLSVYCTLMETIYKEMVDGLVDMPSPPEEKYNLAWKTFLSAPRTLYLEDLHILGRNGAWFDRRSDKIPNEVFSSDPGPLLLGYSMTGEHYIRKAELC